jgi:hypothetical protein
MPAPINVQPVYPYASQNYIGLLDPPLNDQYSSDPDSLSTLSPSGSIFLSNTIDSNGSIVYRIRLTSAGDSSTSPTVTAKLVYVFVGLPSGPKYALYKTFAMPGVTVSNTVPNPELELYFPKGLLIPPNYGIFVAASTNAATTSEYGDQLYYTVEAGDYIQSSYP